MLWNLPKSLWNVFAASTIATLSDFMSMEFYLFYTGMSVSTQNLYHVY